MKMNCPTLLPLVLPVLIALMAAPASAFYNPNTGRWLSRDPQDEYFSSVREKWIDKAAQKQRLRHVHDIFTEQNDRSLYGFARNSPISFIDVLGRKTISNGDPDCERYCAAAEAAGRLTLGGRCVCYASKKCPCASDTPDQPIGVCPAADQCTVAHEQTHCDDPKGVCANTSTCLIDVVRYTQAELGPAECRGLKAELDCLNAIVDAPLGDACSTMIPNLIGTVIEQMGYLHCPE